jgi:hypothetical protein
MPKEFNNKEDFWYDEDIKRYEDLIFTLKNIKEVISHENIKDLAIKYISSDLNFVKEDFK